MANADPWLIADEALDALDRLWKLNRYGSARDDLELAAEHIKQLAMGPEDSDGGIRLKESPGRKPRKRRVASRTFTCQVCGDKDKAIREAKYCSGACNQAAYRERKRESAPRR